MQRTHRPWSRLAALAVLGALLLGACASDSDEGGSSPDDTAADAVEASAIQPGWVNEVDLEETTGGTLDITLPSPLLGLDPTTSSLGVTTGGAPLMAIYDTLLEWDPETNEYSGRIAESIEHTDDYSQWTLTLKPDVQFSDGTAIDSATVVYSIERMRGARGSSRSYPDFFESFETPDAQTVVMNMVNPMNNVDALLASDLGFVVPQAAVEAKGEEFSNDPVGAGPFMVDSYNPDAELVLVKNPNYSLGEVALDGIRFTWNTEQGANVDKLLNGETDMTLLTSIDSELDAIEAGYPAFTTLVAGSGMAINSAPDRDFPGDDPRVRQAISMAIDTESVNERVNGGEGIMGNFLFAPGTLYAVDTPFGEYNAEEATRLVEEVKSETGWDGSFTLISPPPTDYALSYQALLNAVGFDVQVEPLQGFNDLIARTNVGRNFDVAIHVMTTYETNLYQALNRSLNSTSTSNYLGYSNPEMDALLDELRGADGVDGSKEVLDRMAELWQTQQPFVLTGDQPFVTVTGKNVGGVEITANGLILFDSVFKA